MSTQKVNKRISSVMSRPHQKGGNDVEEGNTDPRIKDVLLAFSLAGLDRSDFFSRFFPLHRQIAAQLIDYFISIPSIDDFLKICAFGRDNINPNL